KEKNYSLGILEGTDSVVQILSGRAAPTALPLAPTPGPTVRYSGASSSSDSGGVLLFLVIVGVMIAAGVWPFFWVRLPRGGARASRQAALPQLPDRHGTPVRGRGGSVS